jgi:hypothetical protein
MTQSWHQEPLQSKHGTGHLLDHLYLPAATLKLKPVEVVVEMLKPV